MDHSPIATTREKQITLIIDKNTFLGNALAEKLSRSATVVFVSAKQPDSAGNAIVFIPFGRLMPQIPESTYAHIIFVWDKESVDILEPLARKAKEQAATLFLIVQREDKEKAEEALQSFSEESILLVIGDCFGKFASSPLQDFLYATKENKKITLSHMGLHLWYPVLLHDALEKIEEIISHKENKKILFLGPKHPITALHLAHSLQKIDPSIAIDFSSKNQDTLQKEPREKGHAVFDDYDSIKKMQHVYESIVVARKKEIPEVVPIIFTKSPKKKKSFSLPFYIVYALCIFLLLPLLVGLAAGGVGAVLLGSGLSDMQKGSIASSQQKITAAGQSLSLAKDSLSVTAMELSFVGRESLIDYYEKKVTFGYEISLIAENGIGIYQKALGILRGTTLDPVGDSNSVIQLTKEMSLLMQGVSLVDIPKQYQSSFTSLQRLSEIGGNVIDELPSILGIYQDKSYLVLFQNNMELRPGGGFIGSYGILKLHNGAVQEFSIHDVYDADGQLLGHVEPPFAIRRYIPIVHLFLRDSNFDVDFTKNAQTAAFLLSQETGEKVDGVVGIDLQTVKSALSAVHSVYVPSYNETVTDKNFFTLIEKHVEKNTFPGSLQKKEFLSAFFAAFVDSLKSQKGVDAKALLGNMVSLIEGKDIMAAFSDPLIQTPFSLSNLSGSLPDVGATSSAGVKDFLGISEANLGVNKVNAFVTRKLSHHVSIDDKGNITESVALSLINGSDGTWPGGEYRNYIRFILPDKTSLKSIAINNVEQKIVPAVTDARVYEGRGFVPPVGLEVAQDEELGRTLFGFLVTVPEKSTSTITLTYTLAQAIDVKKLEQTYDESIWKQPGISPYPYDLHIDMPKVFSLLTANFVTPKFVGSAMYSTSISKDTDISVVLTAQ